MRDENQDTIVHAKVDETQGPKVKRKDACLVVIYGQDLGRKYNIVGRNLRIGRATTNDICLSQDAVSREHAYIIIDDFGIKIRDNDSTNGTYINDNKIHEAYLRDGDLVKVGRSIFKFLSGDNIESSYHEEIFRLSTVDGLTQVYNRRYFMETLERELSRARRYDRPLGLLIFDIDYFKRCNDTYGHRAGDYVLKQVAGMINTNAREGDLVARYGGEEFVIIINALPWPGPARFADHIRGLVQAQRFAFEGQHIPITISAGVSLWEPHMHSPARLIELADQRLYRAKQAGRNQIVAQ